MDPTPPTRLLILEDVVTEAELATHRIERSGLRLVWERVETREEFSRALLAFRPDLILSDYKLPGFDGLQALEIAAEIAPEVPFVFLSGTIGEELAIEALKQGAMDYVLKTNPARLVPAVQRALEQADERRARRAAEDRVKRLSRILQLVSGVNAVIARTRDRMDVLHEICRLATGVGGYATAVVAMIEPGTGAARPVAWRGVTQEVMEPLRFSIAEGGEQDASIVGAVLRGGTVLVRHGGRGTASSTERADQTIAVLPLLVDGTTVGAIELTTQQSALVGDEELGMLREIAANVSFALQYLHKDDAVRFLSYFDPMTGLAKRSLFCERLSQLLVRHVAPLPVLTVAVFDIERLSAINDAFGRHVGDALLQLLADRIKHFTERPDLVAHLGGGTFVLVPDQHGDNDTADIREYLMRFMGQPFTVDGRQIPATVRSGFARYPEDGRDASMLVQNAEAALHHARATGQRHTRYRVGFSTEVAARLTLEHRLRVALDAGQLELYYQPKVDIRTSAIVGLEALLRWRDPENGFVSPEEFLNVLESTGMIVQVGDWALRQAIADALHWRALGLGEIRVAVNVSPVQLRRQDFVENLIRLLGEDATGYGLDIEVTESSLVDESAPLLEKLSDLRELGVRIAVDDFGTGYSSLSRLAKLPIDVLKIDRSFTSGLMHDGSAKTLVSTIIELSRAFGLVSVAEGVETSAQLEWLRQAKCDQAQGYWFSRPSPRDEIDAVLRRDAMNGKRRIRETST